MAIILTDIKFLLSGGIFNNDSNMSLGGNISNTPVGNNIPHDVSGRMATVGGVDYRCIYVKNTNTNLILNSTKLWIQSNTTSPNTSIYIGLGLGGVNGVENIIQNENTIPEGINFLESFNYNTSLSIGDLTPNQHYGFWIKRVINPGTQMTTDSFILRIQCDTYQ